MIEILNRDNVVVDTAESQAGAMRLITWLNIHEMHAAPYHAKAAA